MSNLALTGPSFLANAAHRGWRSGRFLVESTAEIAMQLLNPYIHFNGKCEEAFKFYAKVLGGEIKMMLPYRGSQPSGAANASGNARQDHARPAPWSVTRC
jgi:hypothetical protein